MKQHETADNSQGQLYIVPTPIGNLSDITQRALTVLQAVDLIAAEDTRHTGLLLQHFAISARVCSRYTITMSNKKPKRWWRS